MPLNVVTSVQPRLGTSATSPCGNVDAAGFDGAGFFFVGLTGGVADDEVTPKRSIAVSCGNKQVEASSTVIK